MSMSKEQCVTDRLQGMILGVGIGSCLGAPHRPSVRKGGIHIDKLTGVISHPITVGKNCHFNIGIGGDCIEMTIALIQSIIQSDGYDYCNDRYHKSIWIETNSPTVGDTTKRNIEKINNNMAIPTSKIEALIKGVPLNEYSRASNGALLRATPLASIADDEERRLACIYECCITHLNPIAVICHIVFVEAVRMAICGYSKKYIIKRCSEIILKECKNFDTQMISLMIGSSFVETNTNYSYEFLKKEIMYAFNSACKGKEYDMNNREFRCIQSFYCAFLALTHSDSFQDGIETIIRMGGDNDTNASITGGLLGAYFGRKIMECDTKTLENIQIVINAEADANEELSEYVSRPPLYHLSEEKLIKMSKDLYVIGLL